LTEANRQQSLLGSHSCFGSPTFPLFNQQLNIGWADFF